MNRAKDLSGQRFGRYVVLERAGADNYRNALWLCRCDCGSERIVRGTDLRTGVIVSCGCYHREIVKDLMTTHGRSRTRLYAVWDGMNNRCFRHTAMCFEHYGGRGITVCDEWRYNFKAFYDWAMANGYDENAPRGQCTIDRIDNDKGYSPDNCRWITHQEQQLNKRPRRCNRCRGSDRMQHNTLPMTSGKR